MTVNKSVEERLFRKVKQGKAVLFLGAGASQHAGAPSGTELAKMIHSHFLPNTKPNSENFIEILSEVCDTLGINRSEIEEFVRSKLNLQPSEAHLGLCRIRWQSIFTTNYDDLIETAYRIAPKKAQDRCDPIFSKVFSRTESDYMEVVRLFKLMGSVTGRDRVSRMALSRSDYNRKIQQREGLFRLLKDMAKDGTIVYVGYSFKDLIVRDILDEIRDEIPPDEMPWGFALLADWDDETEQMLKERRIMPLRMKFEEFIARSIANLDKEPPPEDTEIFVTVSGISIQVPQSDLKMYERQFEFCHDDIGNQPIADRIQAIRDFLEGQTDPWVGITKGWAFKRTKTQQVLGEVLRQIDRPLEKECPIVLVLGPAGSGKSTMMRMIARDIYANQGLPCLLLNLETEKVDYKIIDSFARFINESVEAQKTLDRHIPIVVMIDEAASRIQEVRRLPQFLISRGIRATILAFARENEWKQAQGGYPIKVESTLSLPDQLETEQEAILLVKHLRTLKVLESAQDDEYWVGKIKTEFENSFWDTLYHLAYPARPPLTLAVRNEYDRLLPIAQTAYRYICAFYQFSVALDLELLARSLHRSYEEFTQSVYDPSSIGVIVDFPEPTGVKYRARTRMVAEQVVKYVYQSTDEWLADIKKIVSVMLPNNTNEVETIRNLLIRRLGPNGTNRVSPPDILIPIFDAVFEAGVKDSTILHHCALLLSDKEDFDGAEAYLNSAIDVLNNPDELTHFKTESRQNIDNSLANVAVRRGLNYEKSGKAGEAEKQFQRASVLFKRARNGEFPNAYPFYGEAWMQWRRAENAGGVEERLGFLAKALQVVDESERNVDDEGESSLAEIESKVVASISGIRNVTTVLSTMEASGDANGSYLLARYHTNIYDVNNNLSGFSLENAYSIVRDALKRTPGHLPCLKLACRLYRRLHPNDWKGWWELLLQQNRLEGNTQPNSLLFDLALAACQLGKYSDARSYLEKLEENSIGNPRRTGVVATIKDDGKERRFDGTVKPGLNRTEGWISCDTLGESVKFYPLRQKFNPNIGQNVTFVLALNYRGYLAIELRPK